VGTIRDWVPGDGKVVSWAPSPASVQKARQAPVSAAPASYMQAQHLRGFCEFADRGLDYSRLVMGSWDRPGRCDIRALTFVINAHRAGMTPTAAGSSSTTSPMSSAIP
jgi:hypothetical protein